MMLVSVNGSCCMSLACLILAAVGCAPRAGPGPVVASTEFRGEIVSAWSDRAGVMFQDGGQPIAVPGGALWVFGDTFLGRRTDPATRRTITGAVSNTIAFLPDGSSEFPPALKYFVGPDGVAAAPLSFFPQEQPDKLRMWPLGGVAVGGRTYLFYSMIEVTDAPGPWNFRGLGSGLAVGQAPLGGYQRLTPGGSWNFSAAADCVLPFDGFLYCYEISTPPGQEGLIIARVAPDRIEDPAAYRYFTGQDWLPQHQSAKVILREAYGQVSVVWNPALRSLLMATSSDFFHPQEFQLRTAANPWGPWSQPTRIAVPPRAGKTTNLVYCTFIHPELSSDDGREITLTFCRMLAGNWELSNPELVRVRLGKGN